MILLRRRLLSPMKTPIRRILYAFCFFLCLAAGARAETVSVLPSGDEILLNDGRVLRLPDIKAAPEAQAFLESYVKGHALTVSAGTQDRYGRIEAQAFLEGNKTSLEETLVREGLAFVYPCLGDPDLLDGLIKQEQAARRDKKGLWAHAQDTEASDAASLAGQYGFITGTVSSVQKIKTKTVLFFGPETQPVFTIILAAKQAHIFKKDGDDPFSWAGRKIRVRGWIEAKSPPTVTLSDPHQLEILSP